MNITLQNSFYHFSIDPRSAVWNLGGLQPADPALRNVQMGVYYRTKYGSLSGLKTGWSLAVDSQRTISSPHGPLRQVELVSEPDKKGLSYRIIFALAEKEPLMLSKMQVKNEGKHPLFLDRLEFLNAGFVYISHTSLPLIKYSGYRQASSLVKSSVSLSPEVCDPVFFSNGWQSWNYTGAYGPMDRYRRTRLGPFTSPMRINPGTPHHKRPGLIGSDMFGVLGDRLQRRGILLGFLSQNEQFGSMEALLDPFDPALRVWANADGARLDPGKITETDWLCVHFLHLDSPDPLGPYLEAVARQNVIDLKSYNKLPGEEGQESTLDLQSEIFKAIPTGWCSWYQYFQRIVAQDIRDNLAAAERLRGRLPLALIQIDDGFEAQIGDWLDFSPAFPEGVAPVSKEIAAAGFVPGLWLAPFIVHRKSRLAREHPDWLLRNSYGQPVNAGFIWDSFTMGLDLTHPAALEYASEVVRTAAQEWGYPYLKLDFLYAAALPGRYRDRTQTRAQVLRKGLEALREAAGKEVFLLGCGCPLGSALGLVDAMRIGADVDVRWQPSYKGIVFYFRDEPDMPSARNAIQNALTRAPLHKRWWINDPDCLLLRADTDLTLSEVQSLAAVIAFTGGSLLLSDDLSQLPPDRLKIAEALLPLIGKPPYLLDWMDNPTPAHLQLDLEGPFGKWYLIGLFNWSEHPKDLYLKLEDFYLDSSKSFQVRSFWDGKLYKLPGGPSNPSGLELKNVPAHGSVVLALNHHFPETPHYVGSDLHISQGLEVTDWCWTSAEKAGYRKVNGRLALRLERPGIAQGRIYLYFPGEPGRAFMNGTPLVWNQEEVDIYSFGVDFNRRAEIEILL
jgi:alpha-galactosidase